MVESGVKNDNLVAGVSAGSEFYERMFRETMRLLERYAPGEKSDEQVRRFLNEDLEELRNADPFIGLQLALRRREQRGEALEGLVVGGYKLAEPSMKSLNDVFLGYQAADDFMAELHEMIRGLGGPDFESLNTFFKGGYFLVEAGDDEKWLEKLREKATEFQNAATSILIRHLEKKLDVAKETKSLSDDGMKCLVDEVARYRSGEKQVKISFGVDKVPDTMDDKKLYMSLRNAMCAANMAYRRAYSDEPLSTDRNYERVPLQEYTLEYFLGDLLESFFQTAVQYRLSDAEDFEALFVELDDDSVMMRRDAIYRHRKAEDWPAEAAFKLFSRHNEMVNVVDVLKNFRVDGLSFGDWSQWGRYVKRVEGVVELVESGVAAIEGGDNVAIRNLVEKSFSELELSLKDEGQKITSTLRAQIKRLFDGDSKVFVFADHEAFGVQNIAQYEEDVLKLFRLLGLKVDDLFEIAELSMLGGGVSFKIHRDKLHELVRKAVGVADSTELTHAILRIGDRATGTLREKEQVIYDHFGGAAVIDASGGDEVQILATYENLEEGLYVAGNLQNIADDLAMRISVALFDAGDVALSDTDRKNVIADKLVKARLWTEASQKALKSKGLKFSLREKSLTS